MPSWRKKPPNDRNFNKRSTPEQRAALADAAQIATARLYNEVLAFWRQCRRKQCKRNRRCSGEPLTCLRRHRVTVAEHNYEGGALLGHGRRPHPDPAGQCGRSGHAAHPRFAVVSVRNE